MIFKSRNKTVFVSFKPGKLLHRGEVAGQPGFVMCRGKTQEELQSFFDSYLSPAPSKITRVDNHIIPEFDNIRLSIMSTGEVRRVIRQFNFKLLGNNLLTLYIFKVKGKQTSFINLYIFCLLFNSEVKYYVCLPDRARIFNKFKEFIIAVRKYAILSP